MTLTKRQQAALETRRKIIEAAYQLIEEKGLDHIMVEDITKKAGVSKGSFYTYFKKKEDIIEVIGQGPVMKINEELAKMDQKIAIKLSYFFVQYLSAMKTQGVYLTKEFLSGELNHETHTRYSYDEKAIKDLLNLAVTHRELKKETPVDLLTGILLSNLYGMGYQYVMSQGNFDINKYAKSYFDQVILPLLDRYEEENHG